MSIFSRTRQESNFHLSNSPDLSRCFSLVFDEAAMGLQVGRLEKTEQQFLFFETQNYQIGRLEKLKETRRLHSRVDVLIFAGSAENEYMIRRNIV